MSIFKKAYMEVNQQKSCPEDVSLELPSLESSHWAGVTRCREYSISTLGSLSSPELFKVLQKRLGFDLWCGICRLLSTVYPIFIYQSFQHISSSPFPSSFHSWVPERLPSSQRADFRLFSAQINLWLPSFKQHTESTSFFSHLESFMTFLALIHLSSLLGSPFPKPLMLVHITVSLWFDTFLVEATPSYVHLVTPACLQILVQG